MTLSVTLTVSLNNRMVVNKELDKLGRKQMYANFRYYPLGRAIA
jgi:hypothetical protein